MMEIEEIHIEGLKIIRLNKFFDNRGSFTKIFNDSFFTDNGLRTDFKESYFSVSEKNVIRGMHFQIPPSEHIKLVFVNQGSITDVVLDIRKNSASFGKFFSLNVSADSPVLIYIPVGCAHGFLSLENQTIVSYMQTTVYNQACDKGIHFNSFGFNWNVEDYICSKRDLEFPTLDEFDSPF